MDLRRRSLFPAILALGAFALSAQAEQSYQAWKATVPSHGVSPTSKATAMDGRGNVAITGFDFTQGGTKIYYTAKYDGTTGSLIWENTYESGQLAGDVANAVTFDSAGNVIVTGASTSAANQFDIRTIKYDAADGTELWNVTYNNSAQNGADEGLAIIVDSTDAVIVTGKSRGMNTNDDFVTIKYNGTTGVASWAAPVRYSGSANAADAPAGLALDSDDNVYVTGLSRETAQGDGYYTAKYLGTTGAIQWGKTFFNPGSPSYGAKSIAVDSAGNAIVTGVSTNANGTREIHTIKYGTATGTVAWTKTYQSPTTSSELGAAFVAVDSSDNVLVSGTAVEGSNFEDTYIHTEKYSSDVPGTKLWEHDTPIALVHPIVTPVDFLDAKLKGMAVDGAGNVVLTGTALVVDDDELSNDTDYYTTKLDATTGDVLWEQSFDGGDRRDDVPAGLAVNSFGDVAVTGSSKEPTGAYFSIVTLRYKRFIAVTGDPAPGAGVAMSGVAAGATLGTLYSPAIGDDGSVAARVTVAAGKKKLDAIFTQGADGVSGLAAVAGNDAVGVTGGIYKSFIDPLVGPNGRIAFSGKISGVPGSKATCVWSNVITGTTQLMLQQGTQVFGLTAGTLLQSVDSVSLGQTGEFLALIKVTGATKGTVLYSRNTFGGYAALSTGQAVTVNNEDSTIKTLSVLSPALGSAGYGRWQSTGFAVAKALLADKRTVIFKASILGGTPTAMLFTGGDASSITTMALWKTFGLPAASKDGPNYATAATLQPKTGGVTPATDTGLVFTSNGTTFASFAEEGATAPNTGGATYVSFLDPMTSSNGDVAFVGSIKGTGVTGKNKTAFWWGSPAMPSALDVVARLGSPATEPDGSNGTATYAGFISTALPGGTNAGPIFMAKIAGSGVSGKNNLGVWAVDSAGLVRRLLRTGDELGRQTVSKMFLLQALPGSFGAARSYNNAGSIAALVTFTDKTQAMVHVGIP